ncbi:hypothetical protein PALB_11580 [Pseudoalteromonas luteoviolacea B = ATCC 29581]|nr:hypothetical protein PALB_11580 [Pseudoalteromonas luteoviolacea B = ATCC 29581]
MKPIPFVKRPAIVYKNESCKKRLIIIFACNGQTNEQS